MEKISLVDKKDNILGYEDYKNCHQGKGILHRGFAIFLFKEENFSSKEGEKNIKILLQKRDNSEFLWPGVLGPILGHPNKDQTYTGAAEYKLKKLFGLNIWLKGGEKIFYQENYQKDNQNIGAEKELCTIFFANFNQDIKDNNFQWVDFKELKKDLEKSPEKYHPILKHSLKIFEEKLKEKRQEEEIALKLNKIFDKYNKLVEPTILKILTSFVDKKHHQLFKYPILTGGKRLRPALAIITYNLFKENKKDYNLKDILFASAGLEIIHNYSLIVDDIIDHSVLRRGLPTCWAKFGKSIAECVGIDYAASVFQASNLTNKPKEISELFAKVMKEIVDGEILDILFEQRGREDENYVVENRYFDITYEDYLKMVKKKTGALLRTSCQVGAILANAFREEIKLIEDYGLNIGIAFQIRDDILDIFGEEEKFGKKIGKDIEERKKGNTVLLFALKELSKKEGNEISKILKKEKIEKNDIKRVISLVNKTKALEKSQKLAESFIQKAKDSLKKLPQNKWNQLLDDIANFIIQREK